MFDPLHQRFGQRDLAFLHLTGYLVTLLGRGEDYDAPSTLEHNDVGASRGGRTETQ
jgi:hypothetical protein